MKIQLTLYKSLILESVKAETHLKGMVDRATDERAIGAAFQEDAGDETFHIRKLTRGLYTSLDKLKIIFAEYLENDSHNNVNNTIDYAIVGDVITFSLWTPDNFRSANADALARLCSKFVEDNMLYLWWGVINQKQAEFYNLLVQEDTLFLHKAFEKGAPNAAVTPYTTSVTVSGSTLSIDVGEISTITYTLSSGAIDDINARCTNPRVLECYRENNQLKVKGLHPGSAVLTLYSLHDESKNATINVSVLGETEYYNN